MSVTLTLVLLKPDPTPCHVPQVPAHKVKLFVGAGGEKIKWIQRKSKCRVQVRMCLHGLLRDPPLC